VTSLKALALAALLAGAVSSAHGDTVVSPPTPDTPQHMHARGATLFATLATCAQFFPVDVAHMRRRQLENVEAGAMLPGFAQTYAEVIDQRIREVTDIGHESWCARVRTIMVQRGLSHLFPGWNPFEADMPSTRKQGVAAQNPL
jgi:hypothetical protein